MRLTVHHSAELLPYWLDSLNKLLASDGLNRDKLLNAGHWHVATFNDRVVGLADSQIVFDAAPSELTDAQLERIYAGRSTTQPANAPAEPPVMLESSLEMSR